MMYKRETPDAEVIIDVLKRNSMTARQLSKLMYGEKTHRDIIKELAAKPDIRSSTLVRICNILEISLDILFSKDGNSENSGDIPSIVGNNNVINSSYVNNDIASLRSENKALKLLLEEKNQRILDLKQLNKELTDNLKLCLSNGTNSGQ